MRRSTMMGIILLLLTSTQGYAACKDDLQQLKPRIERIKFSDKQRYTVANKWMGEAEKAQPLSESECHNYYIRASRALTQPMDAGAALPGGGAGSSRAPVGPVTEAPVPQGAPAFTPPQPKPFFKPAAPQH